MDSPTDAATASPAGTTTTLEAALATTEQLVEQAQKQAALATKELKKARAAAATGQLRELRKALASAAATTRDLTTAAKEAAASYDLDEADYLASGAYTRELLQTAQEQDLTMVQDDDRILCYPSLIRLLPTDAALEIDRRRDRRLRPTVVVASLAQAQQRPPRGNTAPLLASLASAYDLLASASASDRDRDTDTDTDTDQPPPIIRLDAIWKVLTLLPGQARDYTKPEFARDLYLLDQSTHLSTNKGHTLRFHASSGTRGAGVLTTVAKTGQQQRYWGVSFTQG